MAGRGKQSSPPTPWICAGLVALVFLLYARVATHDFVLIDDPDYVTENARVLGGLTGDGVRWAFGATHAGNWHPLTWLSHMLDVELFGPNAGRHHLVSVALHAANAVLLFLALRLMTGGTLPSAFVAALFAVHPLRVESVAWIAERKDLLAGLFWMLTLLAYAAYVRRTTLRRYLGVVGLFALGLMAKPMLVSLPFVLLLLDAWPLGRWPAGGGKLGRLVAEKLPLMALAAASSAITLQAQQGSRAVSEFDVAPLGVRLANALVAYAVYLRQTVWPEGLAFLYPHPTLLSDDPLASLAVPAAVAAVILVAITALVALGARKRPYLPVGWLWYLGTLVPVIGVIQVGVQARADRYTYLPLIGIYIMVAWAVAELARRFERRLWIVLPACAVLIAFAIATYAQVGIWRDSRSLYEHTARVTPDNCVIRKSLGNLYLVERELDRAAREFERALQLEPDFPQAHAGLGDALVGKGDVATAARHYEEAVRLNPEYSEAWHNLGVTRAMQRRPDLAIPHYERALRIDPAFAEAHNNLGLALESLGRAAEAARSYERALELRPDYAAARDNLRRARSRGGAP